MNRQPDLTLACRALTPHETDTWAAFLLALQAAGLPTEDLREPGQAFFAFHNADRTPVGFGGYLLADGDALLRSIVVIPSKRRLGHGSDLLAVLLALAAAEGAHTAWLLTMDAEGFFALHGFVRKERAEAPPAVATAPQFTSICPASAVLMCRPLR
jgi:N-acetylglutamate synthase-like GNAT family acetyltransferase